MDPCVTLRQAVPRPPCLHTDGRFGIIVFCVLYEQPFPSHLPDCYWTPFRTRFRRLCGWGEQGAVSLYERTPTVADGGPDYLMSRTLGNRLPPKTTRSTVHLEVVVELVPVVYRGS